MKKYIAMLRGINVSGQKMIKMAELQRMFEALPFENVKTYIQSGNVIFDAQSADGQQLEKHIAEAILRTFSFEVPVIVLDKEALKAVQQHNPFLTNRNEDAASLYVTFLNTVPDQELVKSLKEKTLLLPDEWVIVEKTIYLFFPDSYGKTKLSNNFFENKLQVSATTRNWKTVNTLVSMMEL